MVDTPNRVDARKLPTELRPLWKKLTEVRELVFGGGHLEPFMAQGGFQNPATKRLFFAAASKQQVADEWALALIARKSWATPAAVAVRWQKALQKCEQLGRRIPGLQIPMRITTPFDVFDVGKELALPPKQARKAKKNV
jgi:hypothetical protein